MKPTCMMLAALACLFSAGCATVPIGKSGCGPRPWIAVQEVNLYLLRVKVTDRFRHNAPFAGARITVIQTGDHDETGINGKTSRLRVPYGADGVDVRWSIPVPSCFTCSDGQFKSGVAFVPLERGAKETEFTIPVDSNPLLR